MRPLIACDAVDSVNAPIGDHFGAAAPILEGVGQKFAVDRSRLGPRFIRCLRTTSAIGRASVSVRVTSRRVKNPRQAEKISRRGAAGRRETTESR